MHTGRLSLDIRTLKLRAITLSALSMALAISMFTLTDLAADAANAADSASAEKSAAEPAAELVLLEEQYREAGPEATLEDFIRLAETYRASGDALSAATALRFVGESHWRMGDYEQAAVVLDEALTLARDLDSEALEAKTLNVLGLLHWDLGAYEAALEAFNAAASIAASLGDRRMQGAVLNNASLIHDERGEYRLAQQQYAEVLRLYDGIDFPRGEGDTLGNLGGTHLLLGDYRVGLDYYQQALAISEQLESVTAMSQDHGNIALCLMGLGDPAAAVGHFDRAIGFAQKAGMQQDVAYWTRGKANAHIRQGHYDDGLKLHRQAVDLYREIGSQTEAVEALHDLGQLYLALGDPASASQQFEQSMVLAREIGLARGITLNLLALGDLQLRRESWEEADALYRQAWERARESGEMGLSADGLLRLSALHRQRQRFPEAASTAAEALAIAIEIGAPQTAAAAHLNLGETARAQAETATALQHYEQALQSLTEATDPDLAWRIHYGAGLAQADRGNLTAAMTELEYAIRLIEGVRDRLEEQRFRAGYVQDKYQVYIDLVRLQMAAGQAENAFSTAERLRSRSYLDLVEQTLDNAEPRSDTLPEAPSDANAEIPLTELRERIRQLRRVLGEENALPAAERRAPAIEVYNEELLAAESAYEALLDDRRRSRRGGSLAAVPTYADVRQQLSEGEALVEYVVADDSVLIFILTREDLQAVSGEMGRERVRSRVELLRDLIGQPEGERWRRPAASLASTLLGPLQATGALEGIHSLYLVPHGILNYLPFALLPLGQDGDRLLLEDFTLAYLPTAAALLEGALPQDKVQRLLAVAPERSRLQHAKLEANAVFELFHPNSRLLLGPAATETQFKAVAGEYDVLHLATHGYFNKLNPMLSGLELEADDNNDGLLELHEILGLKLDADLVTLSACQTGLGSGHFAEIPAGDDFVGLTRAFLYAGSEAVMATLWEVDDASTAELMRQFYQRFRVPAGTSGKAEALAAAQRAMRETKEFHHPYYWAPFVLMGASRSPPGQALGARK